VYPANYYSVVPGGVLPGMAGGQALLGGSDSWFRTCGLTVFLHEWMHNLGIGHAWAYDMQGGKWINTVYQDYSEIMAQGDNIVSSWIGLASPHLATLGWLFPDEILSVTSDGEYVIPKSLSSNARSIRAANVLDLVWLDWREPMNQDFDLGIRMSRIS
jgi:hypothetical protein